MADERDLGGDDRRCPVWLGERLTGAERRGDPRGMLIELVDTGEADDSGDLVGGVRGPAPLTQPASQ